MHLDEIEFTPNCSEESLKKGRTLFPVSWGTAIDYGVGNEKKQHKWERAGCHGYLSGYGSHEKVDVDWITTRFLPSSSLMAFVVSKDCPYSRFILNAETAIEDGCVVVSSDAPYKVMHVINLMTRATTERAQKGITYDNIEKLFDNKMIALFFALGLGNSFSPSSKTPLTFSTYNHGDLFRSTTLASFELFVSGQVLLEEKWESYRKKRSYIGASGLWSKTVGRQVSTVIKDLYATNKDYVEALNKFRSDRDGVQVEEAVTNPFAKKTTATLARNNITCKEFVEFFAPWANKNLG